MTFFTDFGQYKLEAKTKTSSGVEFTTNGSSTHESGAFAGSLETKYKWSEHGKWNSLLPLELLCHLCRKYLLAGMVWDGWRWLTS